MLRKRLHHGGHGGDGGKNLCALRDLRGEIALPATRHLPLATRSAIALLSAFLAFGLTSCGPARADRIVVGSKNFTEQAVLGEIIAQQIEARTHLPVERRFYLAGTYICQQAILSGRIDVYPEYTGTALTAILKMPASGDADKVYDQVRTAYAKRFSLVVAPPLGFNNTFALVIRGDDARRDGIRTISQAAAYTPHWRPGFGYEFMERPDGYQGLVKTYGLKFGAEPRIMDLGLLYKALTSHQVDLVAGNSTDGLISALGLTVLDDDRHYFPPYQAVPILRAATARRHPEVLKALEELAGKIPAEDMRRMNYAVDGEHRDARDVAAEFLKSHRL
ncbi:MAG TPA: glycine betaine ABC transporter substrate-binding protein [Terriglobia bacterium]|nr:glycine betaine ABC transporter substrate-binding protein [Terriglobia bacterium]